MSQFTAGGNTAHQRQCLWRYAKPQMMIAGGKARYAQHSQWVFGKGIGYMAQQFGLQISLAAIGVNNLATVILGHGINGQIAAFKILF